MCNLTVGEAFACFNEMFDGIDTCVRCGHESMDTVYSLAGYARMSYHAANEDWANHLDSFGLEQTHTLEEAFLEFDSETSIG